MVQILVIILVIQVVLAGMKQLQFRFLTHTKCAQNAERLKKIEMVCTPYRCEPLADMHPWE